MTIMFCTYGEYFKLQVYGDLSPVWSQGYFTFRPKVDRWVDTTQHDYEGLDMFL